IGGREEQQDRVDIIPSPRTEDCLLVLADGMGGQSGGALASQAVIDVARLRFQKTYSTDPQTFLSELCEQAHQVVTRLGDQDGHSPGSTCVFLYLVDKKAYWAHVGDSRLYLLRRGEMLHRTRDHSVAQMLVTEGRMAEEEINTSPLKNQLYMRLGGEQRPQPEFGATEAEHGDILALCSDGFWENVNPEEISSTISAGDIENATENLVQVARERGDIYCDNISLAIAQLHKSPRKYGLEWTQNR
ncbi:MAG: protein phosphatase 2C domain-containing protein, partial [Pseudomonadota bacterium]